MSKLIDLTGKRFGKLIVLERSGGKNRKAAWECKCDCGNYTVVASDKLQNGHTKSCGCLRVDRAKEKASDLTGEKFGRWYVEGISYKRKGEYFWKCKCECGTIKNIRTSSLTSGNSKSCGCMAREKTSIRMKENYKPKPIINMVGGKYGLLTVLEMCKHNVGEDVEWLCRCECGKTIVAKGKYLRNGSTTHCGCNKTYSYRLSYPRIYRIWENMKDRCFNLNNERSKDYGDRGITVCDEWKNSFETFAIWALENGYEENLSIDRIDVDGNYEPSNCRWITMFEQMSNMRKNVYVTYKGRTETLSEWCRLLNLKYSTVAYRLKSGWSVEDAFEKPPQGK